MRPPLMPLTLVVRSGEEGAGGRDAALTFDGTRIVIGRGGGCDVRLPDPSVSHRHASLRTSGSDYTLVDEGSTNGTFVGGVRLSPHTPRIVKSGDLIRVGRVWLEAQIGAAPATRDLGMATRELALLLVSQAMSAMGSDTVAKVRVCEGADAGAELRLTDEGRAYVLGRGEACDLPLADADCSREHAQLVRRGATVLVRDLGSRNGVFLGGTRIANGKDVAWRAPTMIQLGQTVLALDEPVAVALIELEEADDEPIPDDVPIPAPPASGAAPLSGVDAASPPAAAPIAPALPEAPVQPAKRRGGWSSTDVAVVATALAVIALSGAGLYWILR